MKELVEKYEAMKKHWQEQIQAQVQPDYQKIFDKYPELTSFRFTAYTPYFNDGEECTYSVNTDPALNDDDFWEWYKEDTHGWKYHASRDITELLNLIPEDVHRAMYGDHVMVTVTRAGVTTRDYDHD